MYRFSMTNMKKCDPIELKKKYGYRDEDKVLLFIGRLTEEKQPMRMIQIYEDIVGRDEEYKLLMIGTGELRSEIIQLIGEKRRQGDIQLI